MEDGSAKLLTRLEHAQIFARRVPEKAEEILQNVFAVAPPAAGFVVTAFAMLGATRSSGMMGARAITLVDIAAYGQAMHNPLSAREVTLVLTMDAAAREEAEKEEQQRKQRERERASQGAK